MDFDEIYEKLTKAISSGEFKFYQTKANLITIFNLEKYIPPMAVVVELGTGLGTSAIMMALSWVAKNVLIYSIDEKITSQVRFYVKKLNLNSSIKFIEGNTRTVDWNQEIHILHVNGDRRYAAVKEDLKRWCPLVKKNGLILFHDYGNKSAPGVAQAVDEWMVDNACSHISVRCSYKVVIKG